MTVSDWINNIRWKYFTNNKSGLIFKELIGEFRMVEQMTENKRYYIGNGENCTICDSNGGGSDFYNMLTQFEAVDRLNEQEELIKRLKEIREEQIETILKQKRKIKELEEENGRMKGAFKRKFDYAIEEVVDEICDEDW